MRRTGLTARLIVLAGGLIGAGIALALTRPGVVFLGVPDPEKALCVLETEEGAGSWTASFTTEKTIERFHVAVRLNRRGQGLRMSLSSQDYTCLVRFQQQASARFSCGLDIPPGTFTLVVEQDSGHQGAVVVVSERPIGVTGWQVLSRGLVVLVAVSGALAWFTRRHPGSRRHALSTYTFRSLAVALACVFAYLLLHEGGHALAAAAFGRYDFSRSDFWGIHGSPHSGIKPGTSVEPWQRAIECFGGPTLPTLAGGVLFFLWRSRRGRQLREHSHNVDLFATGICTMLLFPFALAVPAYVSGLVSDSDWRGFIDNVPGPVGLVYAILLWLTVASIAMLWKLVPHIRALLRSKVRAS